MRLLATLALLLAVLASAQAQHVRFYVAGSFGPEAASASIAAQLRPQIASLLGVLPTQMPAVTVDVRLDGEVLVICFPEVSTTSTSRLQELINSPDGPLLGSSTSATLGQGQVLRPAQRSLAIVPSCDPADDVIVSPSAQAAGSSSSGLSASVVAGAVIGVMFALVALTLLYIYVRKNNQKRKATISGGFDSVTEGTDQQFSPFTVSNPMAALRARTATTGV